MPASFLTTSALFALLTTLVAVFVRVPQAALAEADDRSTPPEAVIGPPPVPERATGTTVLPAEAEQPPAGSRY